MKTPTELKETITAVHAIAIKGGFRVEVETTDGERIIIKKKGTKAPTMVQLYDFRVNGNASSDSISKFFAFAKTISSFKIVSDKHLKSYVVAVES